MIINPTTIPTHIILSRRIIITTYSISSKIRIICIILSYLITINNRFIRGVPNIYPRISSCPYISITANIISNYAIIITTNMNTVMIVSIIMVIICYNIT